VHFNNTIEKTRKTMSGQRRVLLIDDDDAFRYSASRVLNAAGFEVTSYPDYRGALDYLQRGGPADVLVTDIMMPDHIHGFALARMARMCNTDIKVIYITAYDVPKDEAIGPILRKPLNDDELVKQVQLALAA